MREPLSWSFPVMRVAGILVRMHWLFPLLFLGLVLRAAVGKEYAAGSWLDMAWILGLMGFSVLLHEFGHCWAARRMEGDAQEVLLWPLGGLAQVDVPNVPRAHFITAACGPLVNFALCAACALALGLGTVPGLRPPVDLLSLPLRVDDAGTVELGAWDGTTVKETRLAVLTVARLFWVNWFLGLLNLLPGFPLDGGRMLQAALWPRSGYRPAMLFAITAGFITAVIFGVVAIVKNELLLLCLAGFIFITCWQKRIFLETGGEEGPFGYDFSQGYTSLEREEPPAPPKRRQSWWQRWQQRRTTRRMQREQEQREAEERRMDELLEKIQRLGRDSLTKEEHNFLKRVSDRYRNRN